MHALSPFEAEGLCDYSHRQSAGLLGAVSHDGGGPRSRPAAHSGRHKDQVRVLHHLRDLVPALRSSLRPDRGTASCTEAAASSSVSCKLKGLKCCTKLEYREVKLPIFSFFGAKLLDNACASVFTAQSSTPNMPVELSIILFTAFPPPPPTPITLMRQGDPEPSAAARK